MEDNGHQLAFVLGTLLLGGVLAFAGYYLASSGKRRRRLLAAKQRSETTSKTVSDTEVKKLSDQRETSGPPTGSSKRQAKSKKRREAQQEFSHPWMIGALKGHTAPVLDINFSANGKFLASCAEDCNLVPAKKELANTTIRNSNAKPTRTASTGEISSKAKDSTHKSFSSEPSSKNEQQRAILSRRQRKNRTRLQLRERDEEEEPKRKPERKLSVKDSKKGARPVVATVVANMLSARHELVYNPANLVRRQLPLPVETPGLMRDYESKCGVFGFGAKTTHWYSRSHKMVTRLLHYTLTDDQRAQLGYPLEIKDCPGYAYIMNSPHHPAPTRSHEREQLNVHANEFVVPNESQLQLQQKQPTLDVNAREFVPGAYCFEVDSGNGSAGSSVESSDIEESSDSDVGMACSPEEEARAYHRQLEHSIERRCTRCRRPFSVDAFDGDYLYEERCTYHWGKMRGGYECCGGRDGSRGCTTARNHVWSGTEPGFTGPLANYVQTRPGPFELPANSDFGIYALDCEMLFTKRGLEVGKVTVVQFEKFVIYESLVKPEDPIIDYNTRFSGLRPSDFATGPVKSLAEVQNDLLSFIFCDTILIGHALENDLRALRIIHPTVIDTSVAYPHFSGFPMRYSLKTLARNILNREIQVHEHDSAEDAMVTLDLVKHKLMKE